MRRAESLGVDTAGCVSSAFTSLCKQQPVAVFIPALRHASALLLVFILLRPHRKKGSCFPKQSVVGLNLRCSPNFFCPFYHRLHPPPSKPGQERGAGRHNAIPETVWCITGGMPWLGHQAQGWSKDRQGFIWPF